MRNHITTAALTTLFLGLAGCQGISVARGALVAKVTANFES